MKFNPLPNLELVSLASLASEFALVISYLCPECCCSRWLPHLCGFYVGSRDLNPNPYACVVANAFVHWAIANPLSAFYYSILSGLLCSFFSDELFLRFFFMLGHRDLSELSLLCDFLVCNVSYLVYIIISSLIVIVQWLESKYIFQSKAFL